MIIIEINGELYEFPITKVEYNEVPKSYFEFEPEKLQKFNPFGD